MCCTRNPSDNTSTCMCVQPHNLCSWPPHTHTLPNAIHLTPYRSITLYTHYSHEYSQRETSNTHTRNHYCNVCVSAFVSVCECVRPRVCVCECVSTRALSVQRLALRFRLSTRMRTGEALTSRPLRLSRSLLGTCERRFYTCLHV